MFTSEIAVHFPGLQNVDKPTVFVFPKLLVCLDCGFTEFAIPETELLLLGKDGATRGIERSFLSELVAGLPFSGGEIESPECAANEPLSLKDGFYRH
jgi:hypothetical protein